MVCGNIEKERSTGKVVIENTNSLAGRERAPVLVSLLDTLCAKV